VPHLGPEHPDYHLVPIRTVTPELRDFLVFAAIFWPFEFGIFPLLAARTTLQRLYTQLLGGKGVHVWLDYVVDLNAAAVKLLLSAIELLLQPLYLLKAQPFPARVLFVVAWKLYWYILTQEVVVVAVILLFSWMI
jgi:hypothetical protein